MNARKSAVKRYFRTIRSYLPCSHKLKKRITNEIASSVNGFLEDHPDATIADVRAHFGEPQNIAAAYVDDMNTPELLHALRVRRRTITIILVGVITALFMWASCLTYAYAEHTAQIDGTIEISIDDIIDDTK